MLAYLSKNNNFLHLILKQLLFGALASICLFSLYSFLPTFSLSPSPSLHLTLPVLSQSAYLSFYISLLFQIPHFNLFSSFPKPFLFWPMFFSLLISPPSNRVAAVISDVISTILFLLLLSYAITLAAFLVGLELVESYGIACFGMVTAVINLLTQMVVYCAFSENMTNDLFDTADIFYESPWYELPLHLQKLYFFPILRLHRVFRLSGLGVIECSLRVFASVRFFFFTFMATKNNRFFVFRQIVQTAASYFLLMKSLK